MRAFEAAEDEVLINTLKGAPRLDVPDQFRPAFMAEVREGPFGVFRRPAAVEIADRPRRRKFFSAANTLT
jgi:hypothetical protein